MFWFAWFKYKKIHDNEKQKNRIISTVVVLLFMIHPDIATKMFNAFNCLKVDDDYRLMGDIMSVCYKGEHLKYMIAIALPSMILWVVGIPSFGFFLLMKEKKEIDRIS